MSRAPIDQSRWQPWIDHVCGALGVDPALVDVVAIHELAGDVAAAHERPMAPVAAHLAGRSVGQGGSLAHAHRVLVEPTSRSSTTARRHLPLSNPGNLGS